MVVKLCNNKTHVFIIYFLLDISIFITPVSTISNIIGLYDVHIIRIANLLFLLTSITICFYMKKNVIVKETKCFDTYFHNLQSYLSSLILFVILGYIYLYWKVKFFTPFLLIIPPLVSLWYLMKIIYNNYCILTSILK